MDEFSISFSSMLIITISGKLLIKKVSDKANFLWSDKSMLLIGIPFSISD